MIGRKKKEKIKSREGGNETPQERKQKEKLPGSVWIRKAKTENVCAYVHVHTHSLSLFLTFTLPT